MLFYARWMDSPCCSCWPLFYDMSKQIINRWFFTTVLVLFLKNNNKKTKKKDTNWLNEWMFGWVYMVFVVSVYFCEWPQTPLFIAIIHFNLWFGNKVAWAVYYLAIHCSQWVRHVLMMIGLLIFIFFGAKDGWLSDFIDWFGWLIYIAQNYG